MKRPNWTDEFPGAVIVCDAQGVILYLNQRAIKTYDKYGGKKLIGRSLMDCHPAPARTKLKTLLKKKASNAYTIEKNGVKKLIYQSPWYEKGRFKGLVELSLEIPFEMPHFIRKTT